MTTNWLQTYLVEAVRRNLCTQIYCTTCGAMEFRRGVLVALTEATGWGPRQEWDREGAIEIMRALTTVTPDGTDTQALIPAVQCLLFDLGSGIPRFDRGAEALLGDSWAGEIRREMKEHHAASVAERRAREEFQDPVRVQQRREEKKRVKQERHRERLALKKERDRIWREKQGKPDET
jgi:hypothetical protein